MKYTKYIILFTVFYILYYIFSKFVKNSIVIEGIQNKQLYFGQTIFLENIDAFEYSNGVVLAFYSQNKKGGVHGNTLNIQIYDDNYEVEKAIDNSKLLIDYQNVLALIGIWGVDISYSIYKNVITNRNIPLIAPYTGGDLLFNNFDKRVILTRISYKNEINTMLLHMKSKGKKNLCVFHPNDKYGNGCLNNITQCIIDNNYHINLIYSGSYPHGTEFFYNGLNQMFKTEPYNFDNINHYLNKVDSLILICTGVQKNQLIRYFKTINPSIYIYTTSFSGDNVDFTHKTLNTDNIYLIAANRDIQKKYPIIYKNINNEINEYNKDLSSRDKPFKYSQKFFNGWTVGKLIIQALESIEEGTINRKNLINSFYKKKDFQIDDYTFGPFIDNVNNIGKHQAHLYKYKSKIKKYEYLKSYKSVY
jgi:hypothetical protein